MTRLNHLVRRYWPMHRHLVRIADMATAQDECPNLRVVVAWRWVCVLCGRDIVETTEAGLRTSERQWLWKDK